MAPVLEYYEHTRAGKRYVSVVARISSLINNGFAFARWTACAKSISVTLLGLREDGVKIE